MGSFALFYRRPLKHLTAEIAEGAEKNKKRIFHEGHERKQIKIIYHGLARTFTEKNINFFRVNP